MPKRHSGGHEEFNGSTVLSKRPEKKSENFLNLKFKFKLLSAGILFMLAFPLFATLGLGHVVAELLLSHAIDASCFLLLPEMK